MQDKKAYEQHFFEVLCSQITDIPSGNVVYNDAPDVRVHASTEILGIEISRLFRDPQPNQTPLKREEAEQRIIVHEARRIVECSGLSPLVVSVHFAAYPVLRKSDRDTLSQDRTTGHRSRALWRSIAKTRKRFF